MGTRGILTQVEKPPQLLRVLAAEVQLLAQQCERLRLALQRSPEHAHARRHLAVQLVPEAQLAQLGGAVEHLLEALVRPLLRPRLAAEAVADGVQLAQEAALVRDLAQARRGRPQLCGDAPLGSAVLRPERADEIALAQRQLPLQPGGAEAAEQGGGGEAGPLRERVAARARLGAERL